MSRRPISLTGIPSELRKHIFSFIGGTISYNLYIFRRMFFVEFVGQESGVFSLLPDDGWSHYCINVNIVRAIHVYGVDQEHNVLQQYLGQCRQNPVALYLHSPIDMSWFDNGGKGSISAIHLMYKDYGGITTGHCQPSPRKLIEDLKGAPIPIIYNVDDEEK